MPDNQYRAEHRCRARRCTLLRQRRLVQDPYHFLRRDINAEKNSGLFKPISLKI